MSYDKTPSYFPLYWLLNNPHKIVYYFIPNKSPKQLVAFFSIALMNSRFSLTEHVLIQVWPAWSWHRAHSAPAKRVSCVLVFGHILEPWVTDITGQWSHDSITHIICNSFFRPIVIIVCFFRFVKVVGKSNIHANHILLLEELRRSPVHMVNLSHCFAGFGMHVWWFFQDFFH